LNQAIYWFFNAHKSSIWYSYSLMLVFNYLWVLKFFFVIFFIILFIYALPPEL
jgi:hypothetical protein